MVNGLDMEIPKHSIAIIAHKASSRESLSKLNHQHVP